MPAKTLVFGLDGADHRLIGKMISAGELPNFRLLRERSATFEVDNDIAQGNVQFWTSAAVGAGPGAHARYFYMQFDPATYDILRYDGLDLPDVVPFWAQLDAEGYKVAVVDWYRMPVTTLKRGMLMHRWFAHEPLSHTVFQPPEIAAEAARFAEHDPIAEGFASVPRNSAAALKEFLDRTIGRVPIKAAFYADQLLRKDWDLFVACFSEAHNVGHYYLQYEDEDHDLHDASIAAALDEPLRRCYRALDDAVGAVLAAAGENANVMVVGGPAMGRFVSANKALEEIARRIDLGVGASLSAAEAARKNYRSLIPESLRRKIGPLARAVRRKLANSDYLRRRFFAIPHNDNSGAIRINLKGREKFGTVAPGAEYDALIEEIAQGVSSFVDPATGRSIVGRVAHSQRDLAGTNSHLLPDLFIEWDKEQATGDYRRLVSPTFGSVDVAPHERTGDHEVTGFFWAPPGTKTPLQGPADIAPVVLAAVRASAPSG